jgi:glycosyltransferase involved in cell wall biosynthesis
MIAPEPFFEPRGTPFSEFHRIRALADLGHHIDLVTYPFGEDVSMGSLRIFRSARPPFVRSVKVGPSFAKVPLDVLLALSACRRGLGGRYDVVHSHEEGGLIGVTLAGLLRIPHVYDMHSSLPQQLTNFAFSRSGILHRAFLGIEKLMIRRSRVVIVICPALEERVREVEPGARVVLIENAPGSAEPDATPQQAADVRGRYGLATDTPMVVYTGTLEAYQGLDLLLAAMRRVIAKRADAGGKPEQVERVRSEARAAGVGEVTLLAGERPAREIPAYLAAASVLVSPRSRGTNTPLKIYQYLRSGRPIVATRLSTHTQVLDDDTSILTDTTPEAFAEGILEALENSVRAGTVGRRARELADTKYSYDAYLERTRQAYRTLTERRASVSTVEDIARTS